MKTLNWNTLSETEKRAACERPAGTASAQATQAVRDILDAVKKDGDDAVRAYTKKFDGYDLDALYMSAEDIAQAPSQLSDDLRQSIDAAYANIKRFHEAQGYKPFALETTPGLTCERMVVPVGSIGLYIPGGMAPLFSTVLMLGVPSQIAGNPKRVLCTPRTKAGYVHPAVVYAAKLCGINQIAQIGGAQAIAAMAYGTNTIPRVDKIVGPGNIYVTLAKTIAAQESGGPSIDLPAGPSECLVIVDAATPAAFAASDLLAQAEHDTVAQVVLVAPTQAKIDEVLAEVDTQLKTLSNAKVASAALQNSLAIIATSMEEAMEISNLYAPEHLILCFDGAEKYKTRVRNAGSVFVGTLTPESLGDYASGTNHVLPTSGAARAYSGLNVEAFQKTITCQTATRNALEKIGPAVISMAMGETLDAHANAIKVRLAS